MSAAAWDADRHVAVFNRAVETGQWADFVELFAPEAVMEFHGPPVGPLHGRQEIAAAYAAQPPDDTLALVGPVEREGDEHVVPFRWVAGGDTGILRATPVDGGLARLVVTFDSATTDH